MNLARRDPSSRWDAVAEVRRGVWTHHLVVTDVTADFDEEARGWLRESWDAAG